MPYDGSSIEALKGLQGVRMRPAMYIGGTDKRALHHLVAELIDNCIDESVAGHNDYLRIILHSDESITVEDHGRGIPCDIHPVEKIPTIDVILTMLHSGGKFSKKGYQNASLAGLHGVGSTVVNALSKEFRAVVHRDGKKFERLYRKGEPIGDLKASKSSESFTGTSIRFHPDPEIFPKTKFDPDEIIARLRELSYLCPGVEIVFKNEKTDTTESFKSANGIVDYLKDVSEDKQGVYPSEPIAIKENNSGVLVELALVFSDEYQEYGLSFANNVPTTEQGKHVEGFKRALTRAVNKVAKDLKILSDKDKNLTGEEINEGVLYILSVKVKEPQFQGQTKSKLTNEEVVGPVTEVVYEQLTQYLANNAPVAKRVVETAIVARRAREAARQQQELEKKAKGITRGLMPSKLIDCTSKKAAECELFIVEGDSAAGPAKQARNSQNQAVFPLKGKPVNIEDKALSKILENQELKDLIQILGCGIINPASRASSNFDISKLRYNKVVILSDADDDGAHIQCLLATFFFRYMRPLIDAGHIYIGNPPLFMVEGPRSSVYCHSVEDRDHAVKKFQGRNKPPVRFKGLGEMNVSQLKETVIDPKTRRITQLEIEHLAETDRLIRILMSTKMIEERRNYICEHSDLGFIDDLYEKG